MITNGRGMDHGLRRHRHRRDHSWVPCRPADLQAVKSLVPNLWSHTGLWDELRWARALSPDGHSMSVLRPGDESMHYCDSSHRWMCPDPDADQDAWTAKVRAHVEQHRCPPERVHTRRPGCPSPKIHQPRT
jgi:hypothetical protein